MNTSTEPCPVTDAALAAHTAERVGEQAQIPDDARRAGLTGRSGGTAARHRALALRALACGHGVQWAADITGLPLRLVARVAAECRIAAARSVPDVPCGRSLWEALVLTPWRLSPAGGGRRG